VEIVDAELIKDQEYGSMGKNPMDQMKTLLGKLDSMRRSQDRESKVSSQSKKLFHKFMEQVDKAFNNFPNPLEWLPFYTYDLPLLLYTCAKVRNTSIQHNLNKSQTKALAKLNSVSKNEFQPFVSPEPCS